MGTAESLAGAVMTSSSSRLASLRASCARRLRSDFARLLFSLEIHTVKPVLDLAHLMFGNAKKTVGNTHENVASFIKTGNRYSLFLPLWH